jgi:drug/metabolite transporter (DMT)-like permease
MTSDSKSRKSHRHLEMVAGVTMISFSAVWVKLVHVGPTTIGFYRMLFGALILLLIVLFKRARLWYGWQPFLLGTILGLLFAGDLTVWHRSILAVGPGLATVLGNFQVFILAAFGILALRERPGWKALAAIPMAMVGLLLIVGPKWQNVDATYKLGIFFGLATACFYASYVLVLKKLLSRSDAPPPLINVTVSTFATTVAIGLIALLQGESFTIPDTQNLLILIVYGLCGQVLGWLLITRSVSAIPASRVGLILLLQPTLAFVWDVLFFKRPTTELEVVGAIIALAAIYLGTQRPNNKILEQV